MTDLTPVTIPTSLPVQVGPNLVYCPPGWDPNSPSAGLKGHDYALYVLEHATANRHAHDHFVVAMHVLKEKALWKSADLGYTSYSDMALKRFNASERTARRWAVQGKEIWDDALASAGISAGRTRSHVTDSENPLGLNRPSKGASIPVRTAEKRARAKKAAEARTDDDIIDAEIIEDEPTPPAPKAIEAPQLSSVPDIPPNPLDDWEDPAPPAPVQALTEERSAAREDLDALLHWLGTLDAAALAAVATPAENGTIVTFAAAFTGVGEIIKPRAVQKAPAVKAAPAPKRRRNGDPVDPKDCKHPINQRIGTMCTACGMERVPK
ncbi:MAG TPA: hypothetical protein VF244_02825 [Acidimicrobiales bacterium]